jgi:hypothetical protein
MYSCPAGTRAQYRYYRPRLVPVGRHRLGSIRRASRRPSESVGLTAFLPSDVGRLNSVRLSLTDTNDFKFQMIEVTRPRPTVSTPGQCLAPGPGRPPAARLSTRALNALNARRTQARASSTQKYNLIYAGMKLNCVDRNARYNSNVGPGPCILAYGLREFWGRSIWHIDQNLKWHPAYCSLEYANLSEAF